MSGLSIWSAGWDSFLLKGVGAQGGAQFDESEHPRQPAGSERGGEFAPKGGDVVDALAYMRGSYVFALSNLTSGEKNAVKAYRSDDYEFIQGYLRGSDLSDDPDDPIYAAYDEKIRNIDLAISKFQLAADAIVWRGGSDAIFDPDGGNIGTVFEDDGFVSTSGERGVAQKFESGILYRLHLKAGQHVAYFPEQDEDEFLLPRGLKFRVVGETVQDEKGYHILDIEVENE